MMMNPLTGDNLLLTVTGAQACGGGQQIIMHMPEELTHSQAQTVNAKEYQSDLSLMMHYLDEMCWSDCQNTC